MDLSATWTASVHSAIPESNVGYRLLQKMGWRPGGGLGHAQQGGVGWGLRGGDGVAAWRRWARFASAGAS